MTVSLRSALQDLLTSAALLPEKDAAGWCPEGEAAPVVVAPSSVEELATLLTRASQEGWRVLPAGQGTWLDGGGPAEFDVIVSTRRLDTIEEYEPADLTFTAGAGLKLSSLSEATRTNGQWLPLDPPGGARGTLGAAVAIGVSGPLRYLYGTTRDHILGLSMVAGDGRVLRWGGRVVKNVAGFDLTRLSIGSWGSLGVITSVSARLFPVPESDVTLVLSGPDADSLLPAASWMAHSGLPLAALELLDPLGGAESFLGFDPGQEESRAGLVVRVMGSRAQVTEMEDRIRADLSGEAGGWHRLEGADSDRFHARMGEWEEDSKLVFRLALLPSRLASLFEEVQRVRDAVGARVPKGSAPGRGLRVSAHAGAGVVRVAVPGPGERGEVAEEWSSVLKGLRRRLEAEGGSLTLSRAPRGLAKEVGAWGSVGGEAAILRGIKEQFDPRGILAPGRFVV